MKIILCSALLFILISTSQIYSQSDEMTDRELISLPQGLGLSNQMKYSYDVNKEQVIFEDWLNIDYRRGIFTAGIRLEVFQPNDPNPAISRGKERYTDVAYKYFDIELGDVEEGLKLTAGNFYSLFGRGLILKSYEDRNIRIENNLLGFKIEGRYADFRLTALSGMAENADAERKDILQAVDLEYRGLNFLRLGGSFAANTPEGNVARTRLAAFRIQPSIWNFDFYGEYGIKQNDDIKLSVFNDKRAIIGNAFYGNGSFFYGSFSVTGEYKYYDNYSFTSNDGTIFYNTPPAGRKDYTYILLNRHPSALNQSNEQGFQVDINYNLSFDTYFNVLYGQTETLPASSFYQRVLNTNNPVLIKHKEVFVQGIHSWNDKFATIAAFGYSEEREANTKNLTPIVEARYYFDAINTFKVIIEHQHTTDRTTTEQYFTDVITLEYLRSPKLSIALVSELQTKEPTPDRKVRRLWSFLQVGYKFGSHTDVSVLFGTRQAGNICIGGVCRFEPEFSGVELRMFTRL